MKELRNYLTQKSQVVFLCLLWPFPATIPLANFANGSGAGVEPRWRRQRLGAGAREQRLRPAQDYPTLPNPG